MVAARKHRSCLELDEYSFCCQLIFLHEFGLVGGSNYVRPKSHTRNSHDSEQHVPSHEDPMRCELSIRLPIVRLTTKDYSPFFETMP
jgi:hypothetical protein